MNILDFNIWDYNFNYNGQAIFFNIFLFLIAIVIMAQVLAAAAMLVAAVVVEDAATRYKIQAGLEIRYYIAWY